MVFIFFNNNDYLNIELNFYICGIEFCKSGYLYGLVLRSGYMIYYILEGKGIYKINGKIYYLEKN